MRHQNNIDPALLSDLEEELNFGKSISKGTFMPKVKIEKGQSWIVRFLPAELGEKKTWFVRYAQHWVNNKPYFCPKNTSEHLGGDKNADCPICTAMKDVESYGSDAKDRVWKSGVSIKWKLYCLVFEKDLGKGNVIQVEGDDRWNVHEFDLTFNQFEKLYSFYKVGLRKSTQSILDPETGVDFLVSRTTKGDYIFDKMDPAPICNDGEDLQEVWGKIWATVIPLDIKFSEHKVLQEQADKVMEIALGESVTDEAPQHSRRSNRRTQDADDDNFDLGDSEQDSPAKPTRTTRQAPPIVRPSAPAIPTRTVPAAKPALKIPAAPAIKSRTQVTDSEQDETVEPEPQATQETQETKPRLLKTPLKRVNFQPKPTPGTPAVGATDADEEDGVAPENSDPAPVAGEEIQDPEVADEAPPAPVTTKVGGTELSARLQRSLTRVQKNG